MAPHPLHQESNPDTGARPTIVRRWALGLAWAALMLDTLAWASGEGDGGRAMAFPGVCVGSLAAMGCAWAAICCAVVRLCGRWRDGLAWLALGAAAGAFVAAALILQRSAAHVAAV